MYNFEQMHASISKIMKKELFFIVGAPKSGTTWLQKLLDEHVDICCKGESHVANILAPKLLETLEEHNKLINFKNHMLYKKDEGYPMFNSQDCLYLTACAALLLFHKQLGDKDYKCIGEKTPTHIEALDLLAILFPHAKFIHIIRDGRDCCISGWYHVQRQIQNNENQSTLPFHDYVKIFAQSWAHAVHLGLAFQSKYPERCFLISYEDLHIDIDDSLMKIFKFLNVQVTPDIIRRSQEAASFEKLSGGRKRGEEDQRSFFRKGIIGDWNNYFDDKCIAIFQEHSDELLRQLGYKTHSI